MFNLRALRNRFVTPIRGSVRMRLPLVQPLKVSMVMLPTTGLLLWMNQMNQQAS